MAQSPILVLVIVISTMVFEGLLFGDEIAEQSFEEIRQPESGDCDGLLDGFQCGVNYIIDFFRVIFGVIEFLWNLITFGVPGAPVYVRVVVGSLITVSFIWSIVTLIRGN